MARAMHPGTVTYKIYDIRGVSQETLDWLAAITALSDNQHRLTKKLATLEEVVLDLRVSIEANGRRIEEMLKRAPGAPAAVPDSEAQGG